LPFGQIQSLDEDIKLPFSPHGEGVSPEPAAFRRRQPNDILRPERVLIHGCSGRSQDSRLPKSHRACLRELAASNSGVHTRSINPISTRRELSCSAKPAIKTKNPSKAGATSNGRPFIGNLRCKTPTIWVEHYARKLTRVHAQDQVSGAGSIRTSMRAATLANGRNGSKADASPMSHLGGKRTFSPHRRGNAARPASEQAFMRCISRSRARGGHATRGAGPMTLDELISITAREPAAMALFMLLSLGLIALLA